MFKQARPFVMLLMLLGCSQKPGTPHDALGTGGADSGSNTAGGAGDASGGHAGTISAGGNAGAAGSGGAALAEGGVYPLPLTSEDIIGLMKTNDTALPGAPNTSWAKGAIVVMGADLRGDVTPTWWQPNNRYLGDWPWVAPWFVIWNGPSHQAGLNTRVEVRNFQLFTLDPQGIWTKRGAPSIGGSAFARNLIDPISAPADARDEPDGGLSVRLDPSGDVFHGWATQLQVDVSNVRGVFVRCEAKLILGDPNAADDRASAHYVVSVGSDAYVYQGQQVGDFAPEGYNPGLGGSKFTLVGKEWSYVGWINLNSANSVNTSYYALPKPWITMTDAELKANPPPAS